MGRKTGKKKRGAEKNTVPKRAPLRDVVVFNGTFVLQVPEGWRRRTEASCLSEIFGGGGAANLIMDLAPAYIRDTGPPSGDQRLMKFLRVQEAENEATFKAPVKSDMTGGAGGLDFYFVTGWLVEYVSVEKRQGRMKRTTAVLMESQEADMILCLNNGDTENVSLPEIVASLRRVQGAPLPTRFSKPEEPIPVTIKLKFDELKPIAKESDVEVKSLWLVAQAMCFSAAEILSMDAAVRERVNTLRESAAYARHRFAALGVPAVMRHIEDRQARFASEKGPSQAASEQVDDLRARRISIAAALVKAAVENCPPSENPNENERFLSAAGALMKAAVPHDEDPRDFKEYVYGNLPGKSSTEDFVTSMTRWPRLKKYWPRLRRRICSYCGHRTFDLSKPHFLVCGGCAECPGVGRYCSENCQRAHWPEHQNVCPLIHQMPTGEQPWLRKMQNTVLIEGTAQAKSAGISPEEYFSKYMKFRSDIFGGKYEEFVRTL